MPRPLLPKPPKLPKEELLGPKPKPVLLVGAPNMGLLEDWPPKPPKPPKPAADEEAAAGVAAPAAPCAFSRCHPVETWAKDAGCACGTGGCRTGRGAMMRGRMKWGRNHPLLTAWQQSCFCGRCWGL